MGDKLVPPLLLQLPLVSIDERHLQDGRLTLSVADAASAASEYYRTVEEYLQNHQLELEQGRDIVPAVEFALRIFNAENFSGELVPVEREQFAQLLGRYAATDVLRERYLQRLLLSDGEMVHPCVKMSGLLLAALAIATSTLQGTNGERAMWLPYTSIWRLRVHMRHQLVLQHRAHSVFLHLASCVDEALALPSEALSAEHLLEVGHVQNYYHRRELAADMFWRAARKSGLLVSEDTMIGVRTRWQQQRLVQMVVNANSAVPYEPPPPLTEAVDVDVPLVVMSEKGGHDLLDRPREAADAPAPQLQPLQPLDRAIILALCIDIRNTNPYHGLTQHHMQTYVERLLSDPVAAPFIIQSQTLLLRSRLERNRNRVQERAFMQMTELVDQYSAVRDPSRTTLSRADSAYFYSVAYPSIWELQSEYADFCFEENLIKTALDAYERVQEWEKIIKCCKVLDKRKRAESLARELIETDPCNPLLWVALGEATRDATHLMKAWDLSGHRSACPMRALARLALEREEYERVVEYFDEAVRLNPVFGGDWFALGYAAMHLKRWERSGEAFTRVCQIQPNDAYGWNNLASVLLQTGRLRPAFNAMSQALRNNRRDWRMWQNYFAIGCELKEVTETTNALNVLLDIAQRNVKLDRGSLNRFVDNSIAYMEGRIPASSRDDQQKVDAEEDKRNNNNGHLSVMHSSMTSVGEASENVPSGCNPIANTEELEMGGIVPLCSDIELPETFSSSTSPEATAEAERARAKIVERYKERMRHTFQRITELFVMDPDIYACAAKLLSYMDGPLAAYEMRRKELRCCQQKDQWERDADRFARTCECLDNMAMDALAALAKGEGEGKSSQEQVQPDVGQEEPLSLRERVITALGDTLENVTSVIVAAEEYMEASEEYKKLRGELLPRVRSGLEEAKQRMCGHQSPH
ncbi:hypothetical protein ERJ75_000064800 [Trypanosoma vivax]|nr:hypothetical protein ERJ75_000064800 [Trypanosoma vivax]